MRPYPRLSSLAAACLALALIAWAYWPGLTGPFLFDDYGNLDVLGSYGHIRSWQSLLYYLSSGIADPTGRPVALLTFLIDAQSWPADPWPFKRTNLILHLVNTALLWGAIARLQAGLQRRYPELALSSWTPLVAATFWASHPLLVSTTLYVIQREAMLPMTFVLLALLAWERAVVAFARGRTWTGWLCAVPAFGLATLLAGFSKANGFLAPLLVGLTHLWFLRPAKPAGHHRAMDAAAWILLALPSLLIVAYVCWQGWHLWSVQLSARDWTLPQRLLSEPRALWGYAWQLLLPRAGGGGLYMDAFPVSRSWLIPWTTVPAMLALAGSVIVALRFRSRLPIASFAWLFFLCGHLLESSTIPLELYFEHRNYLPAMFLGWPLANALLRSGRYPGYRALLAACLLVTLLLLTNQRASVWGDSHLFNAMSASYESDSARAQVKAAQQEAERGDSRGLASMLDAQLSHPGSVDIAIGAIGMECAMTGRLSPDTAERTRHTLANAERWNFRIYEWLQQAATEPSLRHCVGFGLHGLEDLVAAAETNPQNAASRRKRDLWHVRGRIALAAGNPGLGMHWFDNALALEPDPDYALVQAAALGNAGFQSLGVAHLDFYQQLEAQAASLPIRDMAGVHRWLLHRHGYYLQEMAHLRQQLQADAGRAPSPGD